MAKPNKGIEDLLLTIANLKRKINQLEFENTYMKESLIGLHGKGRDVIQQASELYVKLNTTMETE